MLQRLDIHDGALRLLGGGDGTHLQGIGVLLQQLVGHLRHRVLGGSGLTAVLQAQRQHHLALPQGDGVHQRGLDLLDHLGVVVLQQAGLGAHLDRHHAGQFQIVELLFEPVAQAHQIVVGLRILREAGLLRLLAQLLHLGGADVGQTLLAGQNVHGQFLVVLQVQLIHLVEHGHILEQGDLMVLQILGDLVHVGLDLAVLGLHDLQLVAGLLEQPLQALLLLVLAEALQLHHQTAQILADLAHVLVAHVVQGILGEGRHALLGGGAVLQHLIGVADVDLLGEGVHGLTLLLGQQALVHGHRLDLLFLLLRYLRRVGRQGQLGYGHRRGGIGIGGQGQLRHHVIGHVSVSFLYDKLCVLLLTAPA